MMVLFVDGPERGQIRHLEEGRKTYETFVTNEFWISSAYSSAPTVSYETVIYQISPIKAGGFTLHCARSKADTVPLEELALRCLVRLATRETEPDR